MDSGDSEHVVDGLMNSFHDAVCLGVPRGDQLSDDPIVVAEHGSHFCAELFSSVKDNFSWPGVSG